MSRSAGTYTLPSNSVSPAVADTLISPTDFNTVMDDIETAVNESTYTAGLGATDNRLVRTDGTDTKKIQGSGVTVDDSANMSGVAALSTTTIELGHATDTTIARSGAGDITIEGNAVYRAGGTDVAVADGGTGASTAAGGFRALAEGISTTQGAIMYRDATQWVALDPGVNGQLLRTNGAAANPSWVTASGTGDLIGPAGATDHAVSRYDGATGKLVQNSGVIIDDSGNMSGVGTLSTSGAATVGTTAATAVKIDPAGFVELPEVSAPSTPASGFLRLYAKSDGKTYQKNDSGTETDLSQAGGGGASLQPQNVGLAVSASASALTVALKGSDGNDPSGSNIVYIPFRSATGTTGTITTRQVTSATSLTISSGSTMGVTSATAFRLWLVAFDDAGTVRLGLVNCLSQASSVATSILPLNDNGIASSTAEGGAGAADSAQVFYTGTAVTSKPYRILAYLEWNTSGVTAGTWTTTNLALVQPYHVGIPTPGMPTGRRATTNKTDTFTSSTATTWTDITGYSASITPTSAANAVRWQFSAYLAVGNVNGTGLRMVRGSTAIGVGDVDGSRTQVGGFLNRSSDANSGSVITNQSIDLPQSASSQTYKVQFFLQSDTLYFNRSVTTSDSNVVFRSMSNIQLEEVMT